jgi:ribonuclease P protein component
VVLYVLPGERVARVGFATPRGVGGAVRRNRARRLLKEAWRAVAPRTSAYDIVFVARPDIRGAKTQEIVEEMERALHALGVVAR